jgi:hypothetical protein
VGLGCVFDDGNSVARGQSTELGHIGWQAEEMDRHDRPSSRANECLNACRIDAKVITDISESHGRAGLEDCIERCNEAEGARYHLVTWPQINCEHCSDECRCPVVHGNRKLGVVRTREGMLEIFDHWSLRESAGPQDAQDKILLFASQANLRDIDHVSLPDLGSFSAPPCRLHSNLAGGDFSRLHTRPQWQTHPACRAGLPITSSKSATSRVTTAPAATIAKAPIAVPHTMVAFAPTEEPRRSLFFTISHDGDTARGQRSLVKATCGPMKTSSSIVTPA